MRSRAHAAVVRKDSVRYTRETTGISMYHSKGSPPFMVKDHDSQWHNSYQDTDTRRAASG